MNRKISQIVTLVPPSDKDSVLAVRRTTALNGYIQMSGEFINKSNNCWVHKATGLEFRQKPMTWEIRDPRANIKAKKPSGQPWT